MPTDKDRLKDTRTHLAESRMTLNEWVGIRQQIKPTEEDPNTETGQEPKPYLDEELNEEPMLENQGRRYTLKERRAPRRFRKKSVYC